MRWSVGRRIAAGFALALAVLLAIGIMAYRSTASLIEASDRRQQSYLTVQQLDQIYNLVLGAQRGERGFVITADERLQITQYRRVPAVGWVPRALLPPDWRTLRIGSRQSFGRRRRNGCITR